METGKNIVLVTGATGRQGGAFARELLQKGYPVRALTRHPDQPAARELAKLGMTVVQGDQDDAASLERAIAGAWGVFGVQNSWETGVEREEVQGKRLVEVARKQGVKHFVYASVASAQRKTGIPHFESKWRIEEALRGAGFASYAIVRPVFFMENLTSPWFLPAIQQGQLAMGIQPKTVLQMIAVDDIGKYGAMAFERHADRPRFEIDIASDQLTMPDTATVLSRATGHPVTFSQVPIEEVRKASSDFASMLEWFDRVGYDVDIERNARDYGIRPTKFEAWASHVDWAHAPAAS